VPDRSWNYACSMGGHLRSSSTGKAPLIWYQHPAKMWICIYLITFISSCFFFNIEPYEVLDALIFEHSSYILNINNSPIMVQFLTKSRLYLVSFSSLKLQSYFLLLPLRFMNPIIILSNCNLCCITETSPHKKKEIPPPLLTA
jgi:hypothetical protein